MQHVWFLFKICESILGGICLVFHILGLDKLEPIPHVVFYCGTFFGFTLITLVGAIGIVVRRGAKPLMEAIISGAGTVMFIIASLLSMYHAERDFHLMYLSDFEEPLHNFFKYCKQQSITALATGLLFLLHFVFALDVCLIRQPHIAIFEDENEAAMQPMRLFFISESVQKYLERYEWFRRYSVEEFPRSSEAGDSTASKYTPRRRNSCRMRTMTCRKVDGDERTPSVSPAITIDSRAKENGNTSISSTSLAGPRKSDDKAVNV